MDQRLDSSYPVSHPVRTATNALNKISSIENECIDDCRQKKF